MGRLCPDASSMEYEKQRLSFVSLDTLAWPMDAATALEQPGDIYEHRPPISAHLVILVIGIGTVWIRSIPVKLRAMLTP